MRRCSMSPSRDGVVRRHARRLTAGLLIAAGLALPASLAAAHDGTAIIQAPVATAVARTAVSLTVQVIWEDDGHAAVDATVTAVLVAPDGSPSTPVAMELVDDTGNFAATIPLPAPGQFDASVNALSPTGTLDVSLPDTTPLVVTTTEAPSTTGSPDGDTVDSSSADDDESGSFPLVWVAVGAAVGVTLGVFAARRVRSGRGDDPSETVSR